MIQPKLIMKLRLFNLHYLSHLSTRFHDQAMSHKSFCQPPDGMVWKPPTRNNKKRVNPIIRVRKLQRICNLRGTSDESFESQCEVFFFYTFAAGTTCRRHLCFIGFTVQIYSHKRTNQKNSQNQMKNERNLYIFFRRLGALVFTLFNICNMNRNSDDKIHLRVGISLHSGEYFESRKILLRMFITRPCALTAYDRYNIFKDISCSSLWHCNRNRLFHYGISNSQTHPLASTVGLFLLYAIDMVLVDMAFLL